MRCQCCRSILHDPAIYPEPDAFRPERFLNPDCSLRDDPLLSSAFGYGKRICPGRHFVDATLFIYVASMLSVFHIETAQGDQEKNSEYKYTGSFLRCSPLFVKKQGNKPDLLLLAVRNHSHVPSLPGIKGPRSLSLQIPWRVEFVGRVPIPQECTLFSRKLATTFISQHVLTYRFQVWIFEPLLI